MQVGEGTGPMRTYKEDIDEKLEEENKMENRGMYMGRTCRLEHTHHLLHIPYGEQLCP